MLALNSYENRVYQFLLEEPVDGMSAVVAKFYRPQRWSDAAIAEEHAFTRELAEREIPVVAPLVRLGQTLHHVDGLRFAVFPRRGGRAPELDDPRTLEWIGRFIGRIHAVGRIAAFNARPAIDIASFGTEPRDWLLAHDFIPTDLRPAYVSVIDQALDGGVWLQPEADNFRDAAENIKFE